MNKIIHLHFTALFLLLFGQSFGQSMSCPQNIDFELGTLSDWHLYTGTCCPISTPTSGAVAGRHTITSGTTVDPYGGFPIVAPGVGFYSLKLGNNSTGREAERARYYIRIPTGVNNYSVFYRYAVVFQDPNHTASEQPRFEVKVYDSATGNPVACAERTYIATSSLPGFTRSTVNTSVWYLPWTIGSINLSGMAGTTVAVDFASGDCDLGGHFGYGYVDVSCGLFSITNQECNLNGTMTLSGPPGFQTYKWMDTSYTTTIGTGQSITITTPSVTTKYKLILTPYTGFGCTDTLTTIINISDLKVKATNDTAICKGSSVRLTTGYTGGQAPISFAWTPVSTLSCTNCDTTIATPTAKTSYIVKVTDATGCFRSDTVVVTPSPLVSITKTDATCFNDSNGTITTNAQGVSPFTYSWNTTPVKTTANLTNLRAGSYTLITTDSLNCKDTQTVVITEPTLLSINTSRVDVLCHGAGTGSITATASGSNPPYSYSWNTTPTQTTSTISGRPAGPYTVTVTDAYGCKNTKTDTIKQPTQLTTIIAPGYHVRCFGESNGTALAQPSGGTPPYTYSWNSTPVQTTALLSGVPAGMYTVTVTDANGCTSTATHTITQPALLTATIKDSLNIKCYGSTTGWAKVTVAGGTTPYDYAWNTSPVQTTDTAKNLGAGTYIVTVTDDTGCVAYDTVTLVENPKIVITPSITHVSCFGGNDGKAKVSVSGGVGSAYTYSWNTTPPSTTDSITGKIAGTYVITVTDSIGCKDTLPVVITQPTLLTVSTSKTDVTCFGYGNGTATANVSGGTAPYTYSWTTIPAQTTGTATGLAPGTYTVTVTDAKGCIKTASATITQPTALTSSITSTPISCFGAKDGTATVTASGGTAPYTYSWNTSPTQTTATATGLGAGGYTITVTDAKGCTYANNIGMIQPAQLQAPAGVIKNVSCNGGNDGSITIAPTGGTAPYTYIWLTITPLNFTATASNLPIGTYSVRVTDSRGCQVIAPHTITQPAVLTSSATSTDITCNGANNGTAAVNVSGGTIPYKYSWNTTPVKTTASVNGLAPGTYKVTVTDSNGCQTTSNVTITQPTALAATLTSQNVNCFDGNTGNISLAVTGGTAPYTYLWNTTPVQTSAAISSLKAGSYTVTITDANSCTLLKSVTLTQPAKLKLTMRATNGSCPEYTTGAGEVLIVGGVKPYKILWSDPAGTTIDTVTQLPAGKYAVVVTDSNNCIAADTLLIPKWPSPAVSVKTSDTVLCVGNQLTLTAAGGNKYSWSPASLVGCDTCTSNVSSPTENTVYSIIGINEFGCSDTAYANIEVINRGQAAVDAEVKICVGATAQLNAYNGQSYNWSPGNTLDKSDINNPVAKPDSTTTYTVIIKENKCFTDTLQQTVTVYPYPTVDAGDSVIGVPGASMQFKPTATGAEKYEWLPATGLNCSDCLSPVVTPKETALYTLKAISPGGCYATDTVRAIIACDGKTAYLPNTFSPNGDGRNDVFYPRGQFVTIKNFRIIDRWGEVIFTASNFLADNKAYGWDGNYNSAPAIAGVYMWVLEVGCPNNTTTVLKGNVTVLR